MQNPKESPILIYDDNPDMVMKISLDLRLGGFQAYSCPDMTGLMKNLKERKCSALVVNHILDLEAIKGEMISFILNEDSQNKGIPIVITSECLDEELSTRLKNACSIIKETVKKPFSKGRFTQVFTRIFDNDNNNDSHVGFSTSSEINHEREDSQNQIVKGVVNANDLVTRVSGQGERESDEVITVRGGDQNAKDDVQIISGEKEIIKDEHITIKSQTTPYEKQNSFVVVKGSPAEKKEFSVPSPKDINHRDKNGNTPFMLSASKGSITEAEQLIEAGANLELTNKRGQSAIHLAASSGNIDMVKFLEEKGLKLNVKDSDNRDPLFYAIIKFRIPLINYLIKKGCRLDTRIQGKSYLMLASELKNFELFKLLLIAGTDPNVKDNKSKSIIDYLKKNKQNDFYKFLEAFKKIQEKKKKAAS